YPVWVGRSNATESPVCPLVRLVRYSSFEARADECPEYVRMSQGRSATRAIQPSPDPFLASRPKSVRSGHLLRGSGGEAEEGGGGGRGEHDDEEGCAAPDENDGDDQAGEAGVDRQVTSVGERLCA